MTTPYQHADDECNIESPSRILPLVLSSSRSVLDVGCGLGAWLKVVVDLGIVDYLGIDGDFLVRNMLKIPDNKFVTKDLNHSFSLGRTFDLTICVEVAEHLNESSADVLVNSLVMHSDRILFSAAIPGQDGQNHINEQWPEYWLEKFSQHGFYMHDILRPLIWDDSTIHWWYRQNICLLTKEKPKPGELPFKALVHPELFKSRLAQNQEKLTNINLGKSGVRKSANILLRSLQLKINQLLLPKKV